MVMSRLDYGGCVDVSLTSMDMSRLDYAGCVDVSQVVSMVMSRLGCGTAAGTGHHFTWTFMEIKKPI